MNDIKEYSIYPGQIKVDNEVFFGLDYKITDLFNQIAEENQKKDKEIERLNNIIDDKKERQDIAIRLLQKLFGTDDYEINYIIGIINGQRQIKFDEKLKEGK